MYELHITKALDKLFRKLAKKDSKQLDIILKKAGEVAHNPNRYKNLRNPLQHLKRVHIDSSFVLLFTVDDQEKIVTLIDYDHHDNIYKS